MRPAYNIQQVIKTILFVCLSFILPQAKLTAQTIGGIGAQLILDTAGGSTMPRIFRLVPNTPADQNLKATDYIIKVNGINCKDKTIEEVVALIRGEVGTTVKITVADIKQGKHPREYDLARVSIQTATPAAPPVDPLTAFYAGCENDVKQMKRKGIVIVKTYTSECGNYFFNFNAEAAGVYHIRLMTMEDKAISDSTQRFYPNARIFDGDNETAAITLNKVTHRKDGNMLIALVEGDLTFTKTGVGVISAQIQDDATKCKGMYIVVYK